ncbi:hypothetical protein [Streptomyces yaizuensis]|uniref:Uncharacterized protein n=1 Tax=Streptomyces yaizuensis TaxID=2989713 RepID=A0ABQ5P6P7_9ACTN|nr:hypothetical protein [Streptomyces sp. YSPA8]GLF98266.1 hypothetical protein SYYSPA8_28235 [Streptomyces sp. YSPA8]
MTTPLLPARPAATHTLALGAAAIDGIGDFPCTTSARVRLMRPEAVTLHYVSADGARFDLVSISVTARPVRRDGSVNTGRAAYETRHFTDAGLSSRAPGWLCGLADAHRAGPPLTS